MQGSCCSKFAQRDLLVFSRALWISGVKVEVVWVQDWTRMVESWVYTSRAKVSERVSKSSPWAAVNDFPCFRSSSDRRRMVSLRNTRSNGVLLELRVIVATIFSIRRFARLWLLCIYQ